MPAPTMVMNNTTPAMMERQGVFFLGARGAPEGGVVVDGVLSLGETAEGGGTSPGKFGGNGETGDGVEPTTLIME